MRDLFLLANPDLVESLVCNQCVRRIAEGMLDGLLVGDQRLFALRFGQMQICAERAPRENRLSDLDAVRPDPGLRSHRRGEGPAACTTAGPGQGHLGEEISLDY